MDAEKSKRNNFREVKFDSCKNCPNIEHKRERDTDFKPTPHCKEDDRWFRHIKPIDMICDEHPSIKKKKKEERELALSEFKILELPKEEHEFSLFENTDPDGFNIKTKSFKPNKKKKKEEVKPNGKKEENKEKNNEEEDTD